MTVSALKIAYAGGGSREWARKRMIGLALWPALNGHVASYDLKLEAAQLNAQLGNWLHTSGQPGVVSQWTYAAVPTLQTTAGEIAIAQAHRMFFPVGNTAGRARARARPACSGHLHEVRQGHRRPLQGVVD